MFSVIIPAYNAEKFIKRSLGSVLSQTYRDFELIVVDDGSKDGTRDVVAQYEDDRIRYIYQQNGGVSSARNTGIRESKGEFICFLDSDDEWAVDHLAVHASMIQRYGHCGMFMTGYDLRLNNGEIIHKSQQLLRGVAEDPFTSDNGFDTMIKNGYFFNTNTICCKREVFDRVGLFEVGVKNGEDDDMWFRIFTYYPIAVSKKATTIYDRANCGATGNRLVVAEPVFLRRVAAILSDSDVPQIRKDSLLTWVERNKLSRARQHILAGNKREARKLLRQISLKKSDVKRYVQTVLCLFIPSVLIRKRIDKRDAGYYK